MANQQSGGGRQAPKMTQCSQCGKDTLESKPCCHECGKALLVVCPNASCGQTVKNAKHCSQCGTALAPATTSTTSKEKWEIEATHVGDSGKYSIRVQATKNGKGEPVEIAISTTLNILPVEDANHQPIVGQMLVVSDDLLSFADQPLARKSVKTDNKGLLVLSVEFTGKEAKIIFAIQGCQANTPSVRLKGPKSKVVPDGFWVNLSNTIARNRGK